MMRAFSLLLLCSGLAAARGGDLASVPARHAAAEIALQAADKAAVLSGLDRLEREGFAQLEGRRIGLVTNHTALTRDGRHIADVLAAGKKFQLVALFGPEHGVRGQLEAGAQLDHEQDPRTGVPVHSLYGATNKPTPEMLAGIDLLVFDIQDVGARFYTYISTLFYCQEAAAELGIPFMVLDRPNPIGGDIIEGPMLEPAHRSFVGIHELPIRHGMTIGELARMFNGEGWLAGGIRADLSVIPLENWRREMLFDETGLRWIKPSPNMTSPQTAVLYPGTCLVEATNLSEGRGTGAPFEQIGAPWLDHAALGEKLRAAAITGLAVDTVSFTPAAIPGVATANKHQGRQCHGVALRVTEPRAFRAVEAGLQLLRAIQVLHPDSLVIREASMNRLGGSSRLTAALLAGRAVEELAAITRAGEEEFRSRRQCYLLY